MNTSFWDLPTQIIPSQRTIVDLDSSPDLLKEHKKNKKSGNKGNAKKKTNTMSNNHGSESPYASDDSIFNLNSPLPRPLFDVGNASSNSASKGPGIALRNEDIETQLSSSQIIEESQFNQFGQSSALSVSSSALALII